MTKLTPEQWAEVKQAIANSYNQAKDEIRVNGLIKVTKERNLEPGQARLSAHMEGTVAFDSSALDKKYELSNAEWSFYLAERIMGLGANIRIQGPGHQEIRVTEEFMGQVNQTFADACTHNGFNKIVTHRFEHGNLNEQFYVWSMAYCFLFKN